MPTATRTGWGIVVKGHQFDLDDLIGMLPRGQHMRAQWSDSRGRKDLVLTSDELEHMESASEVDAIAPHLVSEANGLLAVRGVAHTVEYEAVAEFMSDGSVNRTSFVHLTGRISARSRVGVIGTVVGSALDDQTQSAAPADTPAMRHLRAARKFRPLAAALASLGEAKNLSDLYRVYEALTEAASRRYPGGKRSAVVRAGWLSSGVNTRFTYSANAERHSEFAVKPPDAPMTFPEARKIIAEALKRALDESEE